jgi:DNA mismatch repair protein MutL
MNKIKQLSEQEALKIAAGEVVERPASVVKETVENAIDASATEISLYIEQAGKQLIRIVDNGFGMSAQDAKLCFQNHATSKIQSVDDINTIHSFGFRGEALASISSISQITLKTKLLENDLGTHIVYENQKFKTEEECACAQGTDLQIKNLFYNTPVRKKFLKQDETECNQIQTLFHAFCLSNTKIHFKLYRDNRLILNAPAVKTVRDRASQLWSHNFSQNIIPIIQKAVRPEPVEGFLRTNKISQSINISGFISNHNFWRYGRQHIFFFVNNRWVKNAELSKGLLKGYKNVLPPARFPAAFLFITIDKKLVDINIHPRKEEVRFVKPVTVQNTVQQSVTQTLDQYISEQLKPVHQTSPAITKTIASAQEELNSEQEAIVSKDQSEQQPKINFPSPWEDIITKQKPVETFHNPEPIQQVTIEPEKETFKIIGQILKTYIVIENKQGLLIIDQHAAHERILYEKYLKNFEQKDGTRLLFPEIVKLNENQINIILKEKDFFKKQGIELEQIGKNEIALKTSPPKIQSNSLKDLIFEAVEFIEENEQLDEETFRKKLNEHMHSHMACKMAIKAGDELDHTMMQNVVNELMEVDNRFICVHGRPTMWTMSQQELIKKFRRG